MNELFVLLFGVGFLGSGEKGGGVYLLVKKLEEVIGRAISEMVALIHDRLQTDKGQAHALVLALLFVLGVFQKGLVGGLEQVEVVGDVVF